MEDDHWDMMAHTYAVNIKFLNPQTSDPLMSNVATMSYSLLLKTSVFKESPAPASNTWKSTGHTGFLT